MTRVRALCERTGAAVAERIAIAASPLRRTLGFIGRSKIASDEGMWFDNCRAIHTAGMLARIDVVFLDEHGTVVRVVDSAGPFRVVAEPLAHSVLELAAGTFARSGARCGDRLLFR